MNKNFMFCWPAASLYNLVNETNLVHSLVLVYLLILHVSGGYGPIIRRNNCVFATLYTCYSVWMTVWYAEAYAPAFIFINLYMFRAAMGSSSGETTVFLRHFALVILCGWLSGTQKHMLLHLYLLNCTCFGRLWVHHQEKQLCFCDTLYLLFCVDDCLVCRNKCFCIPTVWMTVWYAGTYASVYLLCGWLSGMQEHMLLHTFCVRDCLVCRNICFCIPTGWMTGMQGHMLLHTYCVYDCLVCRNICFCIPTGWMTVWYAGTYASAYLLGGWLSGMQGHMLLHIYCVYDCLVCRNVCSCIPDSHP